MSASSRIRGALALAAALSAAMVTLVPAANPGGGVGTAPPLKASCPASLVQGGHDYHGLMLTMCNFNGQDLTNANFNGATYLMYATLTGADFSSPHRARWI